eukprot:TRINITY_DN713_c5_g1_i1.p1 TRINITY_DN713_c5_g1~~TRINITY_DN713_c5_g1_i1.p1  ORF type:complete len:323 (+),score=77.62 TRINITY_DN713_c5_g1_i1:54-971(+)
MALRGVAALLPKARKHWVGDGFHVRPVFDRYAFSEEISPFLMFDYAEPETFPARKGRPPKGVGQHPHRGFETVTLAFAGEVEHADSMGNRDVIGPGDVQWMTAGRGIVHQEHHSTAFTAQGGTFEMFQLWVNLPAAKKMTPPAYQGILAKTIPTVPLPLGVDKTGAIGGLRIIAGSVGGATGPASTHTPIFLWEVQLAGAAVPVDIPLSPSHSCIAFVRSGAADLLTKPDGDGAPRRLDNQDGVITARGAGTLRLRAAGGAPASVVLMGGEPLNEPIAARGPFVMNTQAELRQAMDDYQRGRMGK